MSGPLSFDDLLSGGYDSVIVASIDMQGRFFGKRITPQMLEERLEEGIHISSCVLSWDIAQAMGLSVAFGGWHTGWHDFRVVPDLDAIYPLPWLEGTALIVSDVIDEATGELLPFAPRSILRRQIAAMRDKGHEPYIGSELEFHMYQGSYDEARRAGYKGLRPTTLSRSDYSIQQTNAFEPFFRDVRRTLDAAGLQVELSQGEWGFGQWEINLMFADALTTADRHVLFKLAVKDMASAAGMAVTFMPRPNANDVGSSCHVHLSLRDAGDTAGGRGHPFWTPDTHDHMSPVMKGALGGILGNAADFMAWYAPTINAYRRTNSDEFAGRGATWSFDNRTTTCRILGHSPSSLRIEYRVSGADLNPYLGFAALLASAGDGIAAGTDPGPVTEGNAYELYAGIQLPADLREAADVFDASPVARGALSDAVVDHYAATARFEWAEFMHAVTDWEMERYFEVI